ncbi:50S ribosome-binding GTPase [symbiont of Argiope bruennichi]|uniref:GTPase n=1 Tax=symbiont of Argiope bruennichi TaxID=2810479 RepID=UPI003DA3810F
MVKTGKINSKTGKNGKDTIIDLPLGTRVYNENNEIICDLSDHNDTFLICKGGVGGHGNKHFKSNYNKTPYLFERGDLGEEKTVTLKLLSLADIGIIGFPNSGKTSLLNKLTNSEYRVANYPFTTLIPNLSVFKIDNKNIFLCDVPGIIENCSLGKGLGIKFLKHIERCFILIYLIDSSLSFEEIKNNFNLIRKELKNYSIDLANKHYFLAFSKIDLIDQKKILEILKLFENLPKEKYFISIKHETELKNTFLKIFNKVLTIKENFKPEVFYQNIELKEDPITLEKIENNLFLAHSKKLSYFIWKIPPETDQNIERLEKKIKFYLSKKILSYYNVQENDWIKIDDYHWKVKF